MKKLAMLLPLLWQPGLMAETVTITTGGEQGIYHQITKEFCRLAHEVDEQLACKLQSSSGSIENLKRLKSGESSYAMVQSDWLYQA
ncbi:TAXI family TRAP transporter solute-binding subunit, partial [Aeromonas veronii]|uniref:TAXI family TRAP transporter solute-binding subunit n=1 Tax=Aeromonas veronii TaxID=654 RepID=UPI0023539EF9